MNAQQKLEAIELAESHARELLDSNVIEFGEWVDRLLRTDKARRRWHRSSKYTKVIVLRSACGAERRMVLGECKLPANEVFVSILTPHTVYQAPPLKSIMARIVNPPATRLYYRRATNVDHARRLIEFIYTEYVRLAAEDYELLPYADLGKAVR